MTQPLAMLSRDMHVAVDLLYGISPERLTRLRSEYELLSDLLIPGQGPSEGAAQERTQLELALEVWAEALEAEVERCEALALRAQRDLQRARLLELWAAIGSAAAGSALVTMIGGGAGSKATQVTVAIVGLGCSAATALIAYLRHTTGNVDKSIYYVALWKHIGEARIAIIHLRAVARGGGAPDDAILKQVQDLLRALREASVS